MKISASITVEDGDQYRVVLNSLELPHDLKSLLDGSVEIVEVTLYRMKGMHYTSLKTLTKITSVIANAFLENPNAILYFYCDDLTMLPSVKDAMTPQEYRSRLFSALFDRYVTKHNISDIFNFPIKINDVEGTPMYIHLFARDCHRRYVEIIGKDLIDNYSKPTD